MKKRKDEILIYVKKWEENPTRTIFEIRTEFDGIDNREPLLLEVPILPIDAYVQEVWIYLYHFLKDRPEITRFRVQYNEETYSEGGINDRNYDWSKLRIALSPDEIRDIHRMFCKAFQSIQW